MITKSAIMLLGLVNEKPLNAYEIIKQLKYMNVKWWFDIADSTVYTTLKNLQKKGFIEGKKEQEGNMPYKTIYNITKSGEEELKNTIRKICVSFDYDTVLFSIAAFYIDIFDRTEKSNLLSTRITYLNQYLKGIEKQFLILRENKIPEHHLCNVNRMIQVVKAEIYGAKELLHYAKGEE